MTTETLSRLDIFSTLTPEEIARVRLLMKKKQVPEGWILFREGDEGRLMYIVLSGSVAISIRTSDGEDVEVSRVGEGSFFGEMSILQKDVRSATCKAIEDCVLLSLDGNGFNRLMNSEPAAAVKIMQRMLDTAATRLQNTGAFLSDMVKWGENARIRAITDDFTGLYNRRFFDEALRQTVTDSLRNGDPVSLAVLDLDYFGKINAEYGESVADKILLEAVSVFGKSFAKTDVLARYGGDEFTFIFPGTEGPAALERCRKAGEAIRKIDVLEGRQGSIRQVSSSIGVASCPIHADTPEELMDRADKALYAAKVAGRDQAVLYGLNESGKSL
jgi:diguanylate cyclase (GGDEF)-like protein